jgi:hypothetical protein
MTHFNISKCPDSAAKEHVSPFQEHPLSIFHFNISKCPAFAAFEHVLLS